MCIKELPIEDQIINLQLLMDEKYEEGSVWEAEELSNQIDELEKELERIHKIDSLG